METSKHVDNILAKAYDPESFRETGHQVVDLLADHLKAVQNRVCPVIPYQAPEKELGFWKDHFASEAGIMDTFETVLKHATNLQHPRYMGHQSAVPAPVSSLAGLLSDMLNNGTGVYEMGPASNAIEKVVTDFMAAHIGYPGSASGILTSGGSLANLTALLAARRAMSPTDVWQHGHREKLAVMVSEESHYCIDRAARIMGLGDKGIIKLPVDQAFKVRTELLPEYLENAKNDGFHVIAVIGCACSTVTGSYDNLEALAAFCKQHRLWFHVDGAHGGGVVFSKKYKALAKGISKADSITIDFHKMLMTPALNTALLFKNGKNAYRTFAQEAQYLWDTRSEEWYNSGKYTFECTKFMMSVKVYTILKSYGVEIFEQNIDQLYDATRNLAQLILKRPSFELALTPEANIVNFRYLKNNTAKDIDTFNALIRQALIESGKFYIVQTIIKNKRYLRCTVMNPLTTSGDFTALLDEIESIGVKLA